MSREAHCEDYNWLHSLKSPDVICFSGYRGSCRKLTKTSQAKFGRDFEKGRCSENSSFNAQLKLSILKKSNDKLCFALMYTPFLPLIPYLPATPLLTVFCFKTYKKSQKMYLFVKMKTHSLLL